MLKIKSIYDPATGDEGLRVLVTRYWPRGVKKESVDRWFRDLGPEPGLIKAWKAGEISWGEFRKRYRAEYRSEEKKRLLNELKELLAGLKGRDATLYCTCRDEHCHREILREMLGGR